QARAQAAAGHDEGLVGGRYDRTRFIAAADEMHDLQPVALVEPDLLIGGSRHDLEIALYRDLSGIERQLPEQAFDRQRTRKFPGFSVKTQAQHHRRLSLLFPFFL